MKIFTSILLLILVIKSFSQADPNSILLNNQKLAKWCWETTEWYYENYSDSTSMLNEDDSTQFMYNSFYGIVSSRIQMFNINAPYKGQNTLIELFNNADNLISIYDYRKSSDFGYDYRCIIIDHGISEKKNHVENIYLYQISFENPVTFDTIQTSPVKIKQFIKRTYQMNKRTIQKPYNDLFESSEINFESFLSSTNSYSRKFEIVIPLEMYFEPFSQFIFKQSTK